MNDKQFYALWGEALNYADRDSFISDAALSSIWGDAEDAQISADRLRELPTVVIDARATATSRAACFVFI